MGSLSGLAPLDAGWVSCTHRAIPAFQLHRPGTVAEAVALLAEPGAVVMAGGIDLIASLRDGARIAQLVWLGDVIELRQVSNANDILRLGAGVTHERIESDPEIAGPRPDIASAWRTIGNVRVRMTGTLGGNLLAGNAQYDAPVLLAAAGATYRFAGAHGETVIDPSATPGWSAPAMALLVSAEIPGDGDPLVLFDRSLKPAVSVALGARRGEGGTAELAAAIGCAYPRPVVRRAGFQPKDLTDSASVVAQLCRDLPQPIDNVIAGGAYRRRMAEVLLRRLIDRLGGEWAGVP